MTAHFAGVLGVSPEDVTLSADGSLIYAAGRWVDSDTYPVQPGDGDLRIYDASTGALVNTIHVGTRLGGVDLSPDGTFLMVTELAPAAGTNTVYKVDLATGAVQSFTVPIDPPSSLGASDTTPFYDVAVLSNGTALLTVSLQGGGSGESKILDLATGTFTDGPHVQPRSFLTPSLDGSEVFIGQPWISNAPVSMFQTGVGIVANTDLSSEGITAANWGTQALNQNTGLVAQSPSSGGLQIFDEQLHHQLTVTPSFLDGVTFDASGQHLFALDDSTRTIVEYSTLNWAVEQTIDIGQPLIGGPFDLGGRLLLSPDESYFTVATSNGLLMVNNPGATPTIPATSGDDTITGTGTGGTDLIDGQAGNDTIDGGGGADLLTGGSGNDVIHGGDGDDVITGGPGNDVIDGGLDSDTASYADAPSAVTVSLLAGTAQDTHGAGVDTLTGIENLYGSAFGDILVGDSSSNILQGQAGDDLFVGGAAADTINGGAGTDRVDYSWESGGGDVFVNLSSFTFTLTSGVQVGPWQAQDTYGFVDTLSSIEHIITGSGNDTVIGSTAAERIETGAGNDFIRGGGGNDILAGGAGNDTYSQVMPGDVIYEFANEGIDQINTSAPTFSLVGYDNIENLFGLSSTLQGVATNGQVLIGNALDNVIEGSTPSAANGHNTLIGNGGNDTLIGGLGGDTLTGGTGNDRFQGTAANLNGDTITDFSVGDKIVITDASLANFSFSVSGATLTYSGGTMTLGSGVSGHLVASAAAAGGVELTLQSDFAAPTSGDFNGDGRSDILWRHDNGMVTDWLGTAAGGYSPNAANALNAVDSSWQIVGVGDFNGDTRDDIMWRNGDGRITNWLGTPSGGFTDNVPNAYNAVSTDWQVAGIGDFNGDHRADILWRNDDGRITDWLSTSNGGYAPNSAAFYTSISTDWQIVGVGDFNGDGKDDIMWRNADGRITNWLGAAGGGFTDNVANAYNAVSLDWQVAGIGDFNGDHRDDILWRNSDGRVTEWLSTSSGGYAPNSANFYTSLSTDWHVASIGDFNGDTRDDILWRNDDGRISDWLGTATGAFADNVANAYTAVDTHWHIQPNSALV